MQTLRKKNSPCKLKNEPTRFLGEGVSFKAKLIGILEVSEARGDRMCQAALADLKMAIRAAGEHKQRITVQISIDGLRLRDEKTADCLYHHPVHKISFIAQDMSDSRAFGYIFGSPDTGHRFFGIKTDKAASQVVIAMRDLFQVVFELKKKEIELAKQHIEHNSVLFDSSGMFVDHSPPDTKGAGLAAGGAEGCSAPDSDRLRKHGPQQSGVVADLLDLQFELNSLQQGIHQMDKITPDDPSRPSTDPTSTTTTTSTNNNNNNNNNTNTNNNNSANNNNNFEADPFGDSFANMKITDHVQPILPPPPSSSKRGHFERQQSVLQTPTSGTSSPANLVNSNKTPPPQGPVHWFDKETEKLFKENERLSSEMQSNQRKNSSSDDDKASPPPSTTTTTTTSATTTATSSTTTTTTLTIRDNYKSIDVFSELDPLGTGVKKPYIDKKDFFQHLKNPPKRVLKELATRNTEDTFPTDFQGNETLKPSKETNDSVFEESSFADFDKFDESESRRSPRDKGPSPVNYKKEAVRKTMSSQPLSVTLPPEEPLSRKSPHYTSMSSSLSRYDTTSSSRDYSEEVNSLMKTPSFKKYSSRRNEFQVEFGHSDSRKSNYERAFPVDFSATSESPYKSYSSSSRSRYSTEPDDVPEPPPRGAGSILIDPPPLPPKKQDRGRYPPRPPHEQSHFHYVFLKREEGSPSPTRKNRGGSRSPKNNSVDRFDDNFTPPPLPQLPKRTDSGEFTSKSAFEDSFNSIIESPPRKQNSECSKNKADIDWPKLTKDITLSQLTSTYLTDLAEKLGMSVQEVTSLTLQQLTECIASLATKAENTKDSAKSSQNSSKPRIPSPKIEIEKEEKSQKTTLADNSQTYTKPLFKATFDLEPLTTVEPLSNTNSSNTYDKYAVFRELLEMEQPSGNLKAQKSSEDEEAGNSENQESGDQDEDDAQSDEIDENISSLTNPTVKLPPDSAESKSPSDVCKYYEMKSMEELAESPRADGPTDRQPEDDEGINEDEVPKIEEDNNENDDVFTELPDKFEDRALEKADTTSEDSNTDTKRLGEDSKESSIEKNSFPNDEIVDLPGEKRPELKQTPSTSSDRYAALREIMDEEEKLQGADEILIQTTEVDLQSVFAESTNGKTTTTVTTKIYAKTEDKFKNNVLDIFEEIKMLNSDTHRAKETKPPPLSLSSSTNLEDMFCPLAETKQDSKDSKDSNTESFPLDNWSKFETNLFPPDRTSDLQPSSNSSPWSPESKDFQLEAPPIQQKSSSSYRRSAGSDTEWKDDEESEESNGGPKTEPCCAMRHPRFEPGFDDRSSFYEEPPEDEKERMFSREKVCRKAPWPKGTAVPHRPPWHKDPRWEEERRRYVHRYGKVPYSNEDEYKLYWKFRMKQAQQQQVPPRPRNGDREPGFWPADLSNYEDECGANKRRMPSWTEDEAYDDEERWYRREFERRRWEQQQEDSKMWRSRGGPPEEDVYGYKKPHEPHYYREGRHYDYPPNWEDEYAPPPPPKHGPEDSPRYMAGGRKKHWPKRPNSANEGRSIELMYEHLRGPSKCMRSDCSDNDSDQYHHPGPRPYRSKSRESYWGAGSDQEYEAWRLADKYGYPPGWDDGPDEPKTEPTTHRRRLNRHRSERIRSKAQQSSPFEDDFTQVGPERPVLDSLNIDSDKQSLSPRSPRSVLKEPSRREPRGSYKSSSSYFDDDLTPTPSASSDTSDRQRIGSDMKMTPEETELGSKPRTADSFASEDSGRDSFFNGDPRFEDAFAFREELDEQAPVPTERTTSLGKGAANNGSRRAKPKSDQYVKKSETVNIFSRENDPFDDEFFD